VLQLRRLDRLTEAWTANDNCATTPPAPTPGSHWQTFSYNAVGGTGTTTTATYNDGCTTGCVPPVPSPTP
jgi:hypothetical protein